MPLCGRPHQYTQHHLPLRRQHLISLAHNLAFLWVIHIRVFPAVALHRLLSVSPHDSCSSFTTLLNGGYFKADDLIFFIASKYLYLKEWSALICKMPILYSIVIDGRVQLGIAFKQDGRPGVAFEDKTPEQVIAII